ncbi:protein of unknown function [Streptomyces murinus]
MGGEPRSTADVLIGPAPRPHSPHAHTVLSHILSHIRSTAKMPRCPMTLDSVAGRCGMFVPAAPFVAYPPESP